MTKFFFQAVTADGKNISGSLEAPDEKAVRAKLSAAKMAVLGIEVFNPEIHQNANMTVFEFSGINLEGKPIKGTIEAEDEYAAFKKLRLEYNLSLTYLVESMLEETQKASKMQQGVDPEMEKKLESESKKIKNELSARDKLRQDNQRMIDKALESRGKESKIIQDEITNLISEVTKVLETNKPFIDPVKRRSIEKQLDVLSRIKFSNSVDHLKKLTEKIFKDLMDPDLFLKKEEVHADNHEQYDAAMGNVRTFTSGFRDRVHQRLRAIQLSFGGMSADEIRKKMETWALSKIIYTIVYFSFVFLSLLCAVALIVSFILQFVGMEAFWGIFFESFIFWFFFGLSLLVSIFFAVDLEIPWPKPIIKYLGLSFIFGLLFLAYGINSPGIFPWTI